MKSDWLLLITSVTLTLILALGTIRWLAPGLLGLPIDLQMVQTGEKVPSFFKGVFREEDYLSKDFLLKDPLTSVRAKPLLPEGGGVGPHDILGFRNRNIPNVSDIVIIGDSQTYGNNVVLENNWPSQFQEELSSKSAVTYTMSVGGWGAVQYLEMFFNAVAFQPRIIIVAFYTGNDPAESYTMAYSHERWKQLRPVPHIDNSGMLKTTFPPPQTDWWPVKFRDGIQTVFTPKLRFISNQNHPAMIAGYDIMAKVAELISSAAKKIGIQTAFTIIPTKELVYLPKIEREGLEINKDYLKLVTAEQRNIERLATQLRSLENAHYIDIVTSLQSTASTAHQVYPPDINGHPLMDGYAAIGRTVAKTISRLLPDLPTGIFAHQIIEDAYNIYLIKEGKAWLFPSMELVRQNGWPLDAISKINDRALATLPRGIIEDINPERFGPLQFKKLGVIKQYN
jgi:hypothetical protein